jgi:hypothetical protein
MGILKMVLVMATGKKESVDVCRENSRIKIHKGNDGEEEDEERRDDGSPIGLVDQDKWRTKQRLHGSLGTKHLLND